MTTNPDKQAEHSLEEHTHGPDCGHQAVEHGDHVDYMHGEHMHAERDGHYEEH